MKKSVQLAIRLPAGLVKEVDGTARYLQRIQKSGVRVTRSDAVRYLIRGGIIHMNVPRTSVQADDLHDSLPGEAPVTRTRKSRSSTKG